MPGKQHKGSGHPALPPHKRRRYFKALCLVEDIERRARMCRKLGIDQADMLREALAMWEAAKAEKERAA